MDLKKAIKIPYIGYSSLGFESFKLYPETYLNKERDSTSSEAAPIIE
jgi:hypothetical protein